MDRRQEQGGGRKGKEAMKGATQINALRLRSPTDLPPAPHHDCPHCGSSSTSFCYNNYSLSQPRYFCKSSLRIWTHGENLRNIPVGGGVIIRQNNNRATGPSPSSSSSNVAVAGPLAVAAAGPSGGGVRRNNKRSRRPSSSSTSTSSFASSSSSPTVAAAAAGRPSAVAANVRGGVGQNNKRSRRPSPSSSFFFSSTTCTVAVADAAGPSNHQNLRVKNNNLPLLPNSTTRSSTTPTITEPPVPMTTSDPQPRPSKHPSSQVILGIGSTEFPLYTFERGRGFLTSRGEPFQSYNRPPPPNPSGDFGASNCLSWLKRFGLSTVCPPPPPPPQQQQQQYHYQYLPQVYRNMGTRGKTVINQPSQIPNMGTRGKAVINQPSQIPNMGRGKAVINQPSEVPMCIRGTVMPGTRGKTVIYHMSPLYLNMNPPNTPSISEQQAEWPPRSFNNNISEQQAEWPPRSCDNNNTTSEAVGMWGRRRTSSSSSSTAGSTTALSTTHPRNALNPSLPLNTLNRTHPRESDDDLLVPDAECDHVVTSFHAPRTPTSSS